MSAQVVVLYTSDAKFDMDYYLSSHMPLVKKLWGSMGLKSWTVLKFPEGPYSVQATLYFDSMDSFQKASQDETVKEILGDVKNFSDKDPLLMPANVVGQS